MCIRDRLETRALAAEQQLAAALDKVEEREALRAQVEGLREALEGAREVTGERDIKTVLQDYQRRELEAARRCGALQESLARATAAEGAAQTRCAALEASLQARARGARGARRGREAERGACRRRVRAQVTRPRAQQTCSAAPRCTRRSCATCSRCWR